MRASRFLPLMLLVALGVAPSAQATGGGGSQISVVASGLDSPRHLAFGARGDLFVAEAGRGIGRPTSDPCFIGGEGGACWGPTGAVTKIDRWGNQRRIAHGLPSMANIPDNDSAIGPHGIIVLGSDTVVITNGGPTEPKKLETEVPIPREDLAAENPVAGLFGKVLLIGPHGRPVPLADIYEFERRVNPDSEKGNPAVDTNPVDLIRDGLRLVVADAGGNALDVVNPFGRVSNLTVFPNRAVDFPFPGFPMQAVPTSIEQGRDRQYYVGQLTGFPFPVGGANVYRVNPRTGEATVFASGFTNIMDLAFGRDGTLYVLEIDADGLLGGSTDGALIAISPRGDQREITLPPGTLPAPGGIAVGYDGLYVSRNSRSPGGGEVVRLRVR